jgi:HAD superfamily hydrolase (TIGR01450 family)
MLNPRFAHFDNFLFDLDGTLWRWKYLLPGAKKVIADLYRDGKSVHFLTNNTALPRAGYAAKLRGFGIRARTEQIINPSLTAGRLFRGKRLFVLSGGIKSDLRAAGVKVVESKPQAVLIGEDMALTFKKLATAVEVVNEGAAAYKCAVGGTWLMGNTRWPGAGAIAAAVEIATGEVAELIGKPSRYMLQELRSLKLKRAIVVGDETYSDIEAGNALGWATALVLTGNSSREDALLARGEQKPDYVLNGVADLLKK